MNPVVKHKVGDKVVGSIRYSRSYNIRDENVSQRKGSKYSSKMSLK